jgi:quercetin 2,3-dioxygenase
MTTERRDAAHRGHFDFGWLQTHHSFSFGEYRDRAHMGFGPLRVINEDWIAPASGFPMHGHQDMEIITWVLQGELSHRDSLGNGSVIRAGEIQRMSAGTGVMHSEMNPSPTGKVHLLQIWIQPDQPGSAPGYEQQQVDAARLAGRLLLVAGPAGSGGVVTIQQDARVYAGRFAGGSGATLKVEKGRKIYVQLARGQITAQSEALTAGDGLKLTDTEQLTLQDGQHAEVLVFDLPAQHLARQQGR